MWPAYQGGKILAVKFGLRALLDRLDELLPDKAGHNQRGPGPEVV
jgi:hypothetical protein